LHLAHLHETADCPQMPHKYLSNINTYTATDWRYKLQLIGNLIECNAKKGTFEKRQWFEGTALSCTIRIAQALPFPPELCINSQALLQAHLVYVHMLRTHASTRGEKKVLTVGFTSWGIDGERTSSFRASCSFCRPSLLTSPLLTVDDAVECGCNLSRKEGAGTSSIVALICTMLQASTHRAG